MSGGQAVSPSMLRVIPCAYADNLTSPKNAVNGLPSYEEGIIQHSLILTHYWHVTIPVANTVLNISLHCRNDCTCHDNALYCKHYETCTGYVLCSS